MRLKQHDSPGTPISLVPMIDVLMIMLVFFMVTSTYLNLQMIPVAQSTDAPPDAAPVGDTTSGGGNVLIRLDADGAMRVRGQPVSPQALATMLSQTLADNPATNVVVLPSGGASTQALVDLLDVVTTAGAQRLRIVRLEGGQ